MASKRLYISADIEGVASGENMSPAQLGIGVKPEYLERM